MKFMAGNGHCHHEWSLPGCFERPSEEVSCSCTFITGKHSESEKGGAPGCISSL